MGGTVEKRTVVSDAGKAVNQVYFFLCSRPCGRKCCLFVLLLEKRRQFTEVDQTE